jgi:hypothetical protein
MYGLKLTIAALALLLGGSIAQPRDNFAAQVNTDTSQPFSWSGSTGDLSVNLWLVRDQDSVYARGTYTVAPRKRVGCGGETLPANGRVTMRAKGNFEAFTGKLLFDSGWTPPFSARKTSATTMSGSIRSVDRGPCRIALHKVIPPPIRRRAP